MIEIKPLVSIIIPCYNHADFVQQSIQSIIDQDYENIELIIIDDGSSDNSVENVKKIIPDCIKRFVRFEFRFRENKGLCATLNEAIDWCQGEYVSPFASDDIAMSDKIKFLVNKIKGSNFSAVFGVVEILGSKADRNKNKNSFIIHNFKDLLFGIDLPSAPAALIDLKKIKMVGGYKESLPIEDWYMWLKLTQQGDTLATFHQVVAFYRRHDSNTTNDHEKMHQARQVLLNEFKNNILYNKAVKFSLLQASRDTAINNKIKSFKMLLLSLPPRKNTFFIFAKIICPKFLYDYFK